MYPFCQRSSLLDKDKWNKLTILNMKKSCRLIKHEIKSTSFLIIILFLCSKKGWWEEGRGKERGRVRLGNYPKFGFWACMLKDVAIKLWFMSMFPCKAITTNLHKFKLPETTRKCKLLAICIRLQWLFSLAMYLKVGRSWER